MVSCCISPPFGGLSTTLGEITYVLLTRAPLYRGRSPFSHDLHVLGAPLTFVLSQDQTLQLDPSASWCGVSRSCRHMARYSNSVSPTGVIGRTVFLSYPRDVSRGDGAQFSRTEGKTAFGFPVQRGAEPSSGFAVCQRDFSLCPSIFSTGFPAAWPETRRRTVETGRVTTLETSSLLVSGLL